MLFGVVGPTESAERDRLHRRGVEGRTAHHSTLDERKPISRRVVVPPMPQDRPRPGLAFLRIPIESDHLFRSNPIADSGVSDHLAGVGVS